MELKKKEEQLQEQAEQLQQQTLISKDKKLALTQQASLWKQKEQQLQQGLDKKDETIVRYRVEQQEKNELIATLRQEIGEKAKKVEQMSTQQTQWLAERTQKEEALIQKEKEIHQLNTENQKMTAALQLAQDHEMSLEWQLEEYQKVSAKVVRKVAASPAPVNHTPALFQPSPSKEKKTLSYPEQVEQMSKATQEKNSIKPEEIQTLLTWVTDGHLIAVEKLLKKNVSLGVCTGTVTDRSNRTFKNITALQYAAWSLDEEMCDLMMNYMGKHNSAMQLKALYDEPNRYSDHGTHYDIKPLIEKTQTYLENYDRWNNEQRCQYWQKEVGGEQRKCPAWLIYAWSEEGKDVAWVKQGFSKKKVKREYDKNRLEWWFTQQYNDGRGVGSAWAVDRGLAGKRHHRCGEWDTACGGVMSQKYIDAKCQGRLGTRGEEHLAKLRAFIETELKQNSVILGKKQ